MLKMQSYLINFVELVPQPFVGYGEKSLEWVLYPTLNDFTNLHEYGMFKYITPCALAACFEKTILTAIRGYCENAPQGVYSSEELITLSGDIIKLIIYKSVIQFYDFPGLVRHMLTILLDKLMDHTDAPEDMLMSEIGMYIYDILKTLETLDKTHTLPLATYVRPFVLECLPCYASTDTIQLYECKTDDCRGHHVYFHYTISTNINVVSC